MNEHIPSREQSKKEFVQIERKSPEIMEALVQAPIYKKEALVSARPASDGETVLTTLSSGEVETQNTAHMGDWVVTNPSGEQYVLSSATFNDRYEQTDSPGVYNAKGYCRAIPNPYGTPIEIQASWGSPQTGDAYCIIADACDENGTLLGEPYLIEKAAFEETYKPFPQNDK